MPSISPPLQVPHLKQEMDHSCLAAAARMVLDFNGLQIAESKLRSLLKTKPAGTNPLNVINLKELGVEPRMLFSGLDELRSFLSQGKPCIALLWTGELSYWDSSKYFDYLHSVVAVGYDGQNVLVNDPAFPNHPIKISYEEFSEAWSYSQQLLILIEASNE